MSRDGTPRSLLLVLFVGFAAVSAVTSAMTSIFMGSGSSKAGSVNTVEADVSILHGEMKKLTEAVDELGRQLRVERAPSVERVAAASPGTERGRPSPSDEGRGEDREESEERSGGGRGNRGFSERFAADFSQLRALRSEDEAERLAAARALLAGEGSTGKLMAIDVLLKLSPAEGLAALRELAANPPEGGRGRGIGSDQLGSALQSLVGMEGINLTSELTSLFNTGNEDMQLASARVLSKQGDDTLMQQLLRSTSEGLHATETSDRLEAIRNIGNMRSSLGSEYLTPLLHDSSTEVRLAALDALRRSGDENAIAQLETLLNDPVERVRERAEQAINSIRGPARSFRERGGLGESFGGRGEGGRGEGGGRGRRGG